MTIVKIVSSFLCTDRYLVVGLDSVTFELELSGNYSMYSYEQFHWPELRLRKWTKGKAKLAIDKLVCSPFTRPENGFCVKSDVCSCEEVSPQVYRVKTVYTIENVDESRGKLSLIWPSRINNVTKRFHLPKVKGESEELSVCFFYWING
ncbi:hypothetical protein PoB_000745500 [Plakobranchus ocellatus]|uniref:Uncharacterized protein n=1 Tax=Plakobranchus ocellatus TaxID=259542 RepID=A0AAV3YEL7_9GAST|nr:hypothetical protein PoB_000745500 [Plakobranchus ocellatus]